MDTNVHNRGSLMTTFARGHETCIGHMFFFKDRPFEPSGKLDLTGITKEECDTHNRLLDEGLINGLDETCQIGQGGTFYYIKNQVQTFTGMLVSADVSCEGSSITFRRKDKTFRGRLQENADCFNFKRIK